MASHGETQPKAISGAGNLYTPEETILHSFSKAEDGATKLAPIQTLSPPVSPASNTVNSFSSVTGLSNYDAPLYPEHSQSDAQQTPLFESDSQEQAPAKRSRSPSFEQRVAVLGARYLGVPYLPATRQAATDYVNQRMAELEELKVYKRSLVDMLPVPKKSAVSERDDISARQLEMLGRSARGSQPTGIRKSKSAPKIPAPKIVAPKPSTANSTSPIKSAAPVKATTPARRAQRAQTTKDDSASPQPGHQPKHKRAAPTKKVAKEDDSTWRELKDFCPPVSSLDVAPRPLRAQWRGNPLDLSEEVDRDQLDPREYELAAELRLRPVQYMANKRRMFVAKVEHIKIGKTFTKTAAQTVTNIDVNKTSRLWEAFERVGWWDEKWFAKWVDQPTEEEVQ